MKILKNFNYQYISFEFIIIVLGTFSIFFLWDIHNFNFYKNININFQFKFLFCFLIVFCFKNVLDKELKKFLFIFIFFFIHQLYTVFFLDIISIYNILSYVFVNIILIIVIYLKDKILDALVISFYLVTFLMLMYYLYTFNENFRLTSITVCSFFLQPKKFIFWENSHFSLLFVSIFIYFSYVFFNRKNLLNFSFLVISIFLVITNFSLVFLVCFSTSIFTIIIMQLFKFISLKKNLNIFFILCTIFFLILINEKKGCNDRIVDIFKSYDYFKKLENISNVNVSNFNLSSLVYLSHFNFVFDNFTKNPLGVGINNYKLYYIQSLDTNLNKKILRDNQNQPLNVNDGRSVLFKGIAEYGIFVLFFLYFFIIFIKCQNIPTKIKIITIPLLITQLIAGAGYFNAGFIVTLFIIVTYSSLFKPNFLIND